MFDGDRALLGAIDAIYQAAAEASYWPAAVQSLREQLRCHCIRLVVHDPGDARILHVWNAPHDGGRDACREAWWEVEAFDASSDATSLNGTRPPILAALGEEVVMRHWSDAGGRTHEWVSISFLGQQREARGRLDVHWRFPYRQASPMRMETLEVLLPHIERAVCVAARLAAKREFNEAARAALECLPHAVFVIGHDRRLLHRNRKGERILAAADALRLAHGELHAICACDDRALQALIHAASEPYSSGPKPHKNLIKLLRRCDPAPYELRVIRLSGVAGGAFAAATGALMVLVNLPGQPRSLAVRDVMALHGLTRMQARVAIELCAGLELQAAATHLGIAKATARTHLHAIFKRIGVHRQTELIALLLTSPLRYRPPSA